MEYSSVDIDDFLDCMVDLYYLNKEDDILWWAKDEQHGFILDPMVHFNIHKTKGFQCIHGAEPSGFVDASDEFTGISQGIFLDEDIKNVLAAVSTMPFGYKYGSNGRWRMTAADNKVGHIVSGDTYVSYNVETTGVWGLQESTSSTDYIIYQIMATHFEDVPYFQAIGQQVFASRSAARDALYQHIKTINMQGTPGAEIQPIYAYICKRNGDLEEGPSPMYETTIDLRGKRVL